MAPRARCHGSADAFAFENALGRAYDAARNRLLDRVHDRILDTLHPTLAVVDRNLDDVNIAAGLFGGKAKVTILEVHEGEDFPNLAVSEVQMYLKEFDATVKVNEVSANPAVQQIYLGTQAAGDPGRVVPDERRGRRGRALRGPVDPLRLPHGSNAGCNTTIPGRELYISSRLP